jgi:hypothetical protein
MGGPGSHVSRILKASRRASPGSPRLQDLTRRCCKAWPSRGVVAAGVEVGRPIDVKSPEPPYSPPDLVGTGLRTEGVVVLAPADLAVALGEPALSSSSLQPLQSSWDDLPPDVWLKDGGRYRRRRHASFVVEGDIVARVAHRAHWQPSSYNALHGGLIRWFEPIVDDVALAPSFLALLSGLARVADRLRGAQPWFVEAHQFRIDTTDGIGRPTPEGAHRDGVDVVAVILVARQRVIGGETRVFSQDGPAGIRFTLREAWTTLILDDTRVVHESTAIQPDGVFGWRDTLVVTLRAGGFQDPPG